MPEDQKAVEAEKADEFNPILTQDDLNKVISSRLERERAKYADYDDVKTKAAEFDKAAEASKSEIQRAIDRADAAEKRAAAFEAKEQIAKWAAEIVKDSAIPASVLRGSTEDELREHFEQLKNIATPNLKPKATTPPGKSPAERNGAGASRAAAALREMRRGA